MVRIANAIAVTLGNLQKLRRQDRGMALTSGYRATLQTRMQAPIMAYIDVIINARHK